ncbi:TonB-dependent receptor plug domain-containing protein [Aquidulcibacter paucihalophilus]|jgi:hypothetical protein|nr:TonB-dependent receptor plug domain-containing protein [Aquidulcibacter paucihalophilus]
MTTLATPTLALAQAGGAEPTAYAAAHYQPYAPQTALDMVRRTPGFVLDEGESELRGFGAAAGNVLIDGLRPSSKGGLVDALSRVPASQVERIELIRGASASEAQGQSLILNIVRKPGGESGAWAVGLERNGNGLVYPQVDLSYSRPVAGWEASVRLRGYWEEWPIRSLRVNRDASGILVSSTLTDLPSTLSEVYLSGDARRPVAGGLLTLTGRFGRYGYYYDQPGETFLGRLPDGTPDQQQMTGYDVERWVFEAGADYTRAVGDWTWRSIGLVNYRDGVETSSDERKTASGAFLSRSFVDSTARPLEVVARTTIASVGNHRLRSEFGGEFAFNRFDRTFALSLDSGSGLVPVPIPAADVTVEEIRADAFANLVWTVNPEWSVEAVLGAEFSRIAVTGDADQSQTFTFLKPALALVWKPSERLQFRAGTRSTVGQLNFNDFAAGATLDDGTTSAGNPDLGPDQTIRWYASIDYRGRGDLAVNFEVFHEDRTDVLEQVLLPSGAPGLANAGNAAVRGVKGSLTLPLDLILTGSRLTAAGQVADSTFEDPLIGRTRPLSNILSPDIDVEFRHDPPGRPFSWGVTWRARQEREVFLVNEIEAAETADHFGAFAETTARTGMKIRLDVRNADTQRSSRNRRFFEPDRSGTLERIEERFTHLPVFVTLAVSGAF